MKPQTDQSNPPPPQPASRGDQRPSAPVARARRSRPAQPLLDIREVAAALRTTEQHVFDLIDEQRLAAVNIGLSQRKFWRVPRRALKRFIRENQTSISPGKTG